MQKSVIIKHVLLFLWVILFAFALQSCKSKEKVGKEDVPYYLPEEFDDDYMDDAQPY